MAELEALGSSYLTVFQDCVLVKIIFSICTVLIVFMF